MCPPRGAGARWRHGCCVRAHRLRTGVDRADRCVCCGWVCGCCCPSRGDDAADTPLPLQWGEYRPGGLVAARFGLREPAEPWLPADAVAAATVVLVPALAVDRTGVRLGRGAGFLRPHAGAGRPDGETGRGGPRRRTRRHAARRTSRRADDPRADAAARAGRVGLAVRSKPLPSPASRWPIPTTGRPSSPRPGGRRTRSGTRRSAAAIRWHREMPCRSWLLRQQPADCGGRSRSRAGAGRPNHERPCTRRPTAKRGGRSGPRPRCRGRARTRSTRRCTGRAAHRSAAKQVPGRTTSSARSRRRTSSRVLQPLCPNSTLTSSLQASPNRSRLKSVWRSQPLTGSSANCALAWSKSALWVAGGAGGSAGRCQCSQIATGDDQRDETKQHGNDATHIAVLALEPVEC